MFVCWKISNLRLAETLTQWWELLNVAYRFLTKLFLLFSVYSLNLKPKMASKVDKNTKVRLPESFAVALQPSVVQVSQNSVLMYEGVVVWRHLSAAASTSSHEHDREMTILSLTANGRELFLRSRLALSVSWLTQLLHFLATWTRRLKQIEWLLRTWRKAAIDVSPSKLLFIDDAWIKWVFTESRSWSVGRASPTL